VVAVQGGVVVVQQPRAQAITLAIPPHGEEREVMVRLVRVVSLEQFVQVPRPLGGRPARLGQSAVIVVRRGQFLVIARHPYRRGRAV
jgi:hypothetical protein